MKTALIVVDAQNIYTSPDSELFCKDADKTISKINKLIEHFQKNDLPIILVRHVHKADGSDLGRMFDFTGETEDDFNFKENSNEVEYDVRLNQPANSKHIIKNRYSSFTGTDLNKILKSEEVEKVVICGFMTNFCCESTARDAHDLDYYVDFIVDATGTPGTENYNQKDIRKVVGELLSEGFAVVYNLNEYLKH